MDPPRKGKQNHYRCIRQCGVGTGMGSNRKGEIRGTRKEIREGTARTKGYMRGCIET